MEQLQLIGRLGRDPQARTSTNGGEQFATFTLAANSYRRGTERTTWYEVATTPGRATQFALNHLKKGSLVHVYGDFEASLYDANDGTKKMRLQVFAPVVNFADSAGKKDDAQSAPQEEAPTAEEAKPKAKATKAKKADPEPPKDFSMVSSNNDEAQDDLPF